MQFPNHLAGAVFDRFGLDVHIKQAGKGYFQITESIAVSPQFYGWLFGLGKEVKIIEPQEVAQEMKALLKVHLCGLYGETQPQKEVGK